MKTSERQRNKSAPTFAHEAAAPSADSTKPSPPPPAAGKDVSPFLSVLITPKLSFSLPRRANWRTPQDIPQSELSEAFLARFPMHFEPPALEYACTPHPTT